MKRLPGNFLRPWVNVGKLLKLSCQNFFRFHLIVNPSMQKKAIVVQLKNTIAQ